MKKHISNFESIESAKSAVLDSPQLTKVKDGDSSKLLIASIGEGKKIQIIGDNLADLHMEEKPIGPSYVMVDLGLPSGTKWANMNIGAASEEQAGLYFAWGDTEGFAADEASGKFSSSWYATRKGHELDDDITPDGGYDAARENMGAEWQMPTGTDFEELLNNTTQSVETINGVQGTKFTAKNGSGNYIFIPFAGCVDGGSPYRVGSRSYSWSSSIGEGTHDHTHYLYCDSNGDRYVGNFSRYFGYSVRGVSK